MCLCVCVFVHMQIISTEVILHYYVQQRHDDKKTELLYTCGINNICINDVTAQ